MSVIGRNQNLAFKGPFSCFLASTGLTRSQFSCQDDIGDKVSLKTNAWPALGGFAFQRVHRHTSPYRVTSHCVSTQKTHGGSFTCVFKSEVASPCISLGGGC